VLDVLMMVQLMFCTLLHLQGVLLPPPLSVVESAPSCNREDGHHPRRHARGRCLRPVEVWSLVRRPSG